jgi:hypothetical protein
MAIKVGDVVRVVDREATQADAKTGLFYNHFRNLSGTIERIYDDNTVCIDVELGTLPEDVAERHTEIGREMRDKWIDGLSQEGRSRLTEQDKRFQLRYKIVVAASDVAPTKGAPPKESSKKPTAVAKEAPVETKRQSSRKDEDTPAPKRPTTKDLEDAEQEYLRARQKKE